MSNYILQKSVDVITYPSIPDQRGPRMTYCQCVIICLRYCIIDTPVRFDLHMSKKIEDTITWLSSISDLMLLPGVIHWSNYRSLCKQSPVWCNSTGNSRLDVQRNSRALLEAPWQVLVSGKFDVILVECEYISQVHWESWTIEGI